MEPQGVVPRCKIVAVGDGAVGKTSLLQRYAYNEYDDTYIQTIFDNWETEVDVNGKPVKLDLWDTAGQEEYDRIRPISYTNTNIFLLSFSLVDPATLKNAEQVWLPEITAHAPRAQIILVGTKSDLRLHDPTVAALRAKGAAPVTTADGEAAATRFGAFAYVETSSKQNINVTEAFHAALRAFMIPPRPSPHPLCTTPTPTVVRPR